MKAQVNIVVLKRRIQAYILSSGAFKSAIPSVCLEKDTQIIYSYSSQTVCFESPVGVVGFCQIGVVYLDGSVDFYLARRDEIEAAL